MNIKRQKLLNSNKFDYYFGEDSRLYRLLVNSAKKLVLKNGACLYSVCQDSFTGFALSLAYPLLKYWSTQKPQAQSTVKSKFNEEFQHYLKKQCLKTTFNGLELDYNVENFIKLYKKIINLLVKKLLN